MSERMSPLLLYDGVDEVSETIVLVGFNVGEALAQGVDGEEKGGLAELVAVRPVFQMPYRAYRENRFPSAVPCDMPEKPYGFVHRKPFPCKFLRVPFQAV